MMINTKPRYPKDDITLSKFIASQIHHLKVFCQRRVAKAGLNYVSLARAESKKVIPGRFDVIFNRPFPFDTVGLSPFPEISSGVYV